MRGRDRRQQRCSLGPPRSTQPGGNNPEGDRPTKRSVPLRVWTLLSRADGYGRTTSCARSQGMLRRPSRAPVHSCRAPAHDCAISHHTGPRVSQRGGPVSCGAAPLPCTCARLCDLARHRGPSSPSVGCAGAPRPCNTARPCGRGRYEVRPAQHGRRSRSTRGPTPPTAACANAPQSYNTARPCDPARHRPGQLDASRAPVHPGRTTPHDPRASGGQRQEAGCQLLTQPRARRPEVVPVDPTDPPPERS